jgi:c-di-GMP-binding flagellar brake protein YcgR
MNNKIFRPLEKIDIIHNDFETEEPILYSSFIETIGEDSMFILPPFQENRKMQSRIGDILQARITTEECAYFFEAVFLNYHWDDLSLWEISLPIRMNRSQLRQFVRVKISLEVELEFLDENLQRTVIKTLTKDFSAGGIQVVMPVAPPADSKVMIILSLADETTLRIKGEFVRIKYPKTESQNHFASITFCEVDNKMTNKIVKYLFDKQVAQRQKDRILFT